MIVTKKDPASRASRGGEAASLTLINVRRPRQAADAPANPIDATAQLQPVAVTPEPAPVSAEQVPPPPSLAQEAPPTAPIPEPSAASPAAPDKWARLFSRASEAPPPAPTPEAPPAVVEQSAPPPSPAPVASPYGPGELIQRSEPLTPPPVEIPTPQPIPTLVARAGAAMATGELSKPAAPPVEAPPAHDDLPTREALIDYWDELRGSEERPQIATLDRRRLAVSWSDSLMVSYQSGDPTLPQMTRFGQLNGEVQYTSMVTEWILSCSRKVSRIGSAMETEQNFPSDRGNRTYRMLLLPFASAAGTSDHVLCNLSAVTRH